MFDKEFLIRGKHATYVKMLVRQKGQQDYKGINVFKTNVQLYCVAPLIGVIKNRRAVEDRNSTDETKIPFEQISHHSGDLEYSFRLVMLRGESSGLDSDQLITRAFKEDEIEEKRAENMELFNQYFRGGIEYLFEELNEGNSDDEYHRILFEMISEINNWHNLNDVEEVDYFTR